MALTEIEKCELKFAFIVSSGCSNEVDIAHARPPAKADFRTFSVANSIGGETGKTVAASNHRLLYMILRAISIL